MSPDKAAALREHVTRAMRSGKEHSTTSLGRVSEANVARVAQLTNVPIAGYERVPHSSDIRHVMKSHGDVTREAARGQVAIRKRDFLCIPMIVEAAHEINAIGVSGARKAKRLEYVARLGEHEYHYVEELRSDHKIALKAMRKRVWGGARGE